MKNKIQTEKEHGEVSIDNGKDLFDTHYYIIIKRLLCIHGQWPYQTILQKTIRVIITTILAPIFLIPQCSKMIKSMDNSTLFIECLAIAMTTASCLLKMINSVIASKKLRQILDEIRFDWVNTTHETEKQILRELTMKGKLITIIYLVVICLTVLVWISTPLIPKILDRYYPLNHTRQKIPIYQMDYKVLFNIDQDAHEGLIYLHGVTMCAYGSLMLVAADTLYIAVSHHICGLFRILRYRLESIGQDGAPLGYDSFEPHIQDDICYHQIIDCMTIHKRLIRTVRLMEATNEWILIAVLGFSSFLIPCIGAQVVNANTPKQDAARFGLWSLAGVIHLFCNILPGHWITCESERIRDSSYSVNWYTMSRRCRGLIVIVLRRTATPCTITAGRLCIMSMENFCAVLRMTMSYFTMLTSI